MGGKKCFNYLVRVFRAHEIDSSPKFIWAQTESSQPECISSIISWYYNGRLIRSEANTKKKRGGKLVNIFNKTKTCD